VAQGHKVQDLDLSDSEEGDADPDSDEESNSDSDEEGSEGEPITAKNMEKRSKALEKKARKEAEEELKEQLALQEQTEEAENAMDVDDEETDGFKLPTAEEKEEETKNGVNLNVVQRRITAITRILNHFSKLAEPGRQVHPISGFTCNLR
jgi:ribosomal RNA methyltransferase Nop2